MGTTSRLIMVYAGTKPQVDLFADRPVDTIGRGVLLKGLNKMMELHGEFQWTVAAKTEIARWHKAGEPPIPEHSKLQHYLPRRIIHVLKLCMIAAISRTGEMLIDLEDVTRARDWLFHAENLMPDIFRDMTQKSDALVIQDLHYFLWTIWSKKKEPIHESRLFNFLQTKVPSEKIEKVLDTAVRSNVLTREAGSSRYIPRPKHDWGVE